MTQFKERALGVFPGGISNGEFGLPPDALIAVARGEGCRLWDTSGKEYLDFSMGWGSCLVGHARPEVVEAVEEHRFEPVRSVSWRNRKLDFASPRRLLKSLERPPPMPELMPVRRGEDMTALSLLARDPEVAALAEQLRPGLLIRTPISGTRGRKLFPGLFSALPLPMAASMP